jgi:ribonuclease P protein component
MSARFPKSNRLLKSKEFLFIQRQGRKVSGVCLQFLVFRSQYHLQVRLGLTVSAKYGPSVARNLFKRRNREIFRQNLASIPASWIIHIRPYGKVKHAKEVASYEALAKDWTQLLKQLQSWSEEAAQPIAAKEASKREDQDDGSRNPIAGAQ